MAFEIIKFLNLIWIYYWGQHMWLAYIQWNKLELSATLVIYLFLEREVENKCSSNKILAWSMEWMSELVG